MPPTPPPLKVLSWNIGRLYFPKIIRRLIGDGLPHPKHFPNIAAHIEACAPDVIFFQEIPHQKALDELLGHFGKNCKRNYKSALTQLDGDRQIAALWRAEMDWIPQDIATASWSHALCLEGHFAGETIRLWSIHGSSGSDESRARYIESLLGMITETPRGIELLLGDLNLSQRFGSALDRKTLSRLRDLMHDCDPQHQATFLGLLRLDYAFYRPRYPNRWSVNFECPRGWRQGTQDHDPIIVELQNHPSMN